MWSNWWSKYFVGLRWNEMIMTGLAAAFAFFFAIYRPGAGMDLQDTLWKAAGAGAAAVYAFWRMPKEPGSPAIPPPTAPATAVIEGKDVPLFPDTPRESAVKEAAKLPAAVGVYVPPTVAKPRPEKPLLYGDSPDEVWLTADQKKAARNFSLPDPPGTNGGVSPADREGRASVEIDEGEHTRYSIGGSDGKPADIAPVTFVEAVAPAFDEVAWLEERLAAARAKAVS